ncbi:CAunnamed protein product, partial [Biomphalaria glabrata]
TKKAMTDKGDKLVGLIDGAPKESSRSSGKMGANSSASRVWIVVAILFIAASIALAGYIIYVKVVKKPTPMTETEMIRRYPLMFRTPGEQEIFEKNFFEGNTFENLKMVENLTDPNTQFCSFSCSSYRQNVPNRKRSIGAHLPLMEWITLYKSIHAMTKRDVTTPLGPNIYHGCCISRHYFISPDFGLTVAGSNYTLVQYDDRRQYFPSQVCKHAKDCKGCGCAQETSLFSAIVVNPQYPHDSDDSYTMVAIKLPGCCKCFNNLASP